MIYILMILFLAFAMLVLAAYGYALSKVIDNLSYKIVTTVRGKQK